ncbi:MAG: hypothetical protein H0S79_26455 [Anaerolineaceae bacterium]|nr:hypothetical protein [Anaerolineaceae bacterium]
MYDLNILPIHLRQGRNTPDSTGIQAFSPPRRAARGREEDVLILALHFSDKDELSDDLVQTWTEHLSHTFYKTAGTVTAALRSLIETLNLTLMERNIKTAAEGVSVTAAVNLAVIHRRSLYIAQAGQTYAFVLNHQGLERHTDNSQTDRGLGVSRTPTIRYYQDEIGTGAYFFTTTTPLENWQDSLHFSESYPSLDQLRRRLLNQAPSRFDLGLVQLLAGEGKINLIRPVVRGTTPEQPAPQETDEKPVIEEPPVEQEKVTVPIPAQPEIPAEQVDLVQEESTEQPEEVVPEQPRKVEPRGEMPERETPRQMPAEQPMRTQAPSRQSTQQRPLSHMRSEPEVNAAQTHARPSGRRERPAQDRDVLLQRNAEFEEKSLKGISAALKWWRKVKTNIQTFFRDLVAHWSPEGTEPTLSKSSMIFIAVAVPLVVVALAVGVYLSQGKSQQYEYYYQQAEQYAQAASMMTDPVTAKGNWTQALEMVDMAETYRSTDETVLLRDQVEDALDLLDGAVRLDYRPALTGTLFDGIEITRIISVGADLYLMDEAGGRVIHAESRSSGFEVDADFVCAAGNFETGSIGNLVDMVALPINNPYLAHVLAIDAQGNVAYCGAGMDPIVSQLPQGAGLSGEVTAITYASNTLYALIPSVSTVRVYYATNSLFSEAPTEFFAGTDAQNMPDLNQAVDLAVNGDMLYLLRADGSLVSCEANAVGDSAVVCEKPVSYVDGRVGFEDQAVLMPTSVFNELLFTSPPDQTISMLDSNSGDIFQFSQTFRLHQMLRPSFGSYEVEDPTATAFYIGIDRVAFIAFGHQLFYGYLGQ